MTLEKRTTSEGLRIYVDTVPNSRIADIQVLIGTGSVHETDEEAGLSHALEHCTHVTEMFPTRQKLRDFDGENSILSNANTSYTRILHFGLGPYVEPIMQRMGEVLFRATFESDYVTNEVKAINKEAQRDLDDIEGVHRNGTYYGLFGVPYGRDILGYSDDLSFTPEQLRAYYKRHYVQSNMALVAVGNVTMEEILQNIDRYFEPTPSPKPHVILPKPQRLDANATGLLLPGSENARLTVSTPINKKFLKKYRERKVFYETAIDVIRSQCLESLRFDAGLAYTADASLLKHNHPNAWTIAGYVTTSPENIHQAHSIITDIMNSPADSYSDKKIASSIGRLKTYWLRHVDSSDGKVDLHTGSLEQGMEPANLEDFADTVLSQTPDKVRSALQEIVTYLSRHDSMTHITGPEQAIQNVDELIEQSTIM